MSSNFNYAKAFGFESVVAAVVFAILYVPPSGWFLFQTIGHRTRTFITLTIFCLVRLVAFGIRAYLTASDSAGENESTFITDEVLFSVGFFGLLYASYVLVLDRLEVIEETPRGGPIDRITRNRRLFRVALLAAMVLGIIGIEESTSTSSSSRSTGEVLRKASVIVFLVLTVLQVYQTLVLISTERRGAYTYYQAVAKTIGAEHGAWIFGAISILLLVRETFMVATIGSTAKQNNEDFWYPLVAVPEYLCVLLYATPGLVPPKTALPK